MSDESRPSLPRKVAAVLASEVEQLRPRLGLLTLAGRLLPRGRGAAGRAALLRLAGFRIGEGTRVHGMPRVTGGELPVAGNLVIGRDCELGEGCALELGERLTVQDAVSIGRHVLILTTTHELGAKEHRAGALVRRPVTLERGARLGERCVVLPGVTVGEGAVVEPGAVVTKDVPAHARVAGTPARIVQQPPPAPGASPAIAG